TYDEARETAIYALARCRSEDIERVVAALADTASTDARGRVVDAALGALGVMGGSTDPRIYQRLVLDPTLENAELFSTERGTEADARREVGIRAEAMLCRLRAGTLGTDVNVYATLNDLGRKA